MKWVKVSGAAKVSVRDKKCSVIDDFTFMDDNEDWELYIKTSGRTKKETRYYIICHKARVIIARDHWSVGNNLHWMLDVVFEEGSSRRKAGNSAANFNIISKIALGLIERTPF